MSRVVLVAACYRSTVVLIDAVTVIMLLARLEDSMQLPATTLGHPAL